MREALRGLYVITDPLLTPSAQLETKVTAALAGGCRIVQYRDKSQDFERRYKEASTLRRLCHAHGARLIINDDIALALACDADGVHVGQMDAPASEARRRLGPDRILGVTCHGQPALAVKAIAAGADYVAFGRFFASGTKPDAQAARMEEIAPHLSTLPIPAVAIGGITLSKGAPLVAAGFSMLAVIGDIFARDCPQIEVHCRAYGRLFEAPASTTD